MARRFIHITVVRKRESNSDLEAALDKALDWFRYAPNSWIVWTSSDADRWYSRLKRYVRSGDRMFICELNIRERSGWMPRSFWDFLRSHQDEEVEEEN
jgi:hypothetical protein